MCSVDANDGLEKKYHSTEENNSQQRIHNHHCVDDQVDIKFEAVFVNGIAKEGGGTRSFYFKPFQVLFCLTKNCPVSLMYYMINLI